jgi:PAS domain S-box-containing protein
MVKKDDQKTPPIENPRLDPRYAKLSEPPEIKDILTGIKDIVEDMFTCLYVDFILVKYKNPEEHAAYQFTKSGKIEEEIMEPHGITNQVIKTKKSIAVEDVSQNPNYYKYREITKSEICVPIFYKKTVIGCINLEFDSPQKFNKATIKILEAIGRSTGVFLSNSKLHEDLKTSEERFRIILETMNEGIWVGGENHMTTYVNPKFVEMCGLSKEECLKKDCYAFYEKECTEEINKNHEQRDIGESSQYELTMVRPDGSRLSVLCSGTPMPGGGTAGIFTDLTLIKEKEEQKKQEAIIKTQRFLAHVLENSIEAIVNLDRNLVIKTWNRGAERMFSYKKEEAVGQNIKMLLSPDKLKQGELEQVVKMTLEKGFLKNFETVRIKKDEKEVDVSLSVTKLTDEKDRFIGFGVIYRDITYQKKAEKELQTRFESMQNAYMELGKQRRQLDYLLETLNIAISEDQFPNVENYIVNAAIMLTKANGATLRIYNEKNKTLQLKAVSGVQPEWWGKSKVQFEGSIHEKAYQLKQPLFINDIQNHPGYNSPKLAAEHNFVSCLVVPLYVKLKQVGSISLYSTSRNKLQLIDNSFISDFGKQASLALLTNTVK